MAIPPPFGAIQQECLATLRAHFGSPPVDLFHYTSGDGLHGILKSGQLRGTNFTFMNDRSEFTYGFELLRERAHGRLVHAGLHELDRRFYEGIVGMAPPVAADLYLTCFCEEGDLLSQWRGYGSQDSRYCIHFRTERLHGSHELVSPLVRVIYERDKQVAILDDLLDRHIKGFELLKKIKIGLDGTIPISLWCIYTCCLLAFALFKDWAFHEESEWRTTMFVQTGERIDELDFASGGGMIKPFFPLMRGTGEPRRLPITEIIAGASRSERQAVKAAELLLAKFGYTTVKVVASKVPLSG